MKVIVKASNGKSLYYAGGRTTTEVKVDEPSRCPLCKHYIKPDIINVHPYLDNKTAAYLVVTYLCTHCYHPFLIQFSVDQYSVTEPVLFGPSKFENQNFDESIEGLSPSFVKIYNQALAAESTGLDEIAGIGYRKSLEFLIKDLVIKEHPEDKQKIEDM